MGKRGKNDHQCHKIGTDFLHDGHARGQVATVRYLILNGEPIPFNTAPKFLSVTLDRMLTFRDHAEWVAEKMHKAMAPMKALKGTSWGTDKETLRVSYLAYVESQFKYGAPAYTATMKKTNMQKIEVQQLQACRIITRCTMNSKRENLFIEADVTPASIQASTLQATAYLKSLSLDENNKRRTIAEKEVRQRTKKPNFRRNAKNTLETLKLDKIEVEPTPQTLSIPPWKEIPNMEIHTEISDRIGKKADILPHEANAILHEELEAFENSTIDVFTDGAALQGNELGGSGVYIRPGIHNTGLFKEIRMKTEAGIITTSFRSEQIALRLALDQLQDLVRVLGHNQIINIFTDSTSNLARLKNGPTLNKMTACEAEIWNNISKLARNHQIKMIWIPSHVGNQGNDKADKLAKEGTKEVQSQKVDFATTKTCIKCKMYERWNLEAKANAKMPNPSYVPGNLETRLTVDERRRA